MPQPSLHMPLSIVAQPVPFPISDPFASGCFSQVCHQNGLSGATSALAHPTQAAPSLSSHVNQQVLQPGLGLFQTWFLLVEEGAVI